jgi:TDG/mug DNA glycosylase family protein
MDILPDILENNLKVVFCGTAPSRISANKGAYYANERNRFWRILYECSFTETRLRPEQFAELKNRYIGLTDLCKFAFGNDDQLPPDALTSQRLVSAIQTYQPHFLAFTSRKAGRVLCGRNASYGVQRKWHNTKVWVLPTTSPRWGEVWWNQNKHHWYAFTDEVRSQFPGCYGV